MNRYSKGFTLIELLVVIAIIGLLSSIILSSLTNARVKAQATRYASDFTTIKQALLLLAFEENRSTWWLDDPAAPTGFGADNVPISTMVADTTRLGKFLSAAPTPIFGGNYIYDYDGNNFTCGVYSGAGAQLVITNMPTAVITELDNKIDRGDGATCGKIIYSGSVVRYMLGYTAGDMIK